MIDTTLMMVTYNRIDLTKETLNNLFIGAGRDFNLIIVDNGSTDGTTEYLKTIDGENNIKVIYLQSNKGIAIGRNIALKEANSLNTRWYCTIDNDVILPNNWLQECISILENNRKFAAIGVNFEGQSFPLVESGGFTFQEKPAGNLGTALMVFRKELHQMIGYFNTEYGKYGEEDADFGMRARVAGFKLGYLKDNGIHLGSDENDVGEYRKFKTKQHSDNLALFKSNCAAYARGQKNRYIPYKD